MEKLTIKDIAKMSGVSTTVVSFVINNKPGVNADTRSRVNEVLQRTGFKPSLSSRRMVHQKSFNISIIMRNDSSPFSNLFYFEIAQGILEKSKEFGYNIVFTDISEKNGDVLLPQIIEQKDTDGIIFFQDTERNILNEMERREIPYLVIDTHQSSSSIFSINADYELAAYTATLYLMENGHCEIGFISSSFIPDFYTQVFSGYKRALSTQNLSIPSGWIQMDVMDEESAFKAMENILQQSKIPTAIFCAADIFAVGAMRCADEKGYHIPEDISFTSIDDILLSRYIKPKLTTIRIDKFKIGSLALELLIRRMNGEPSNNLTVESNNLIVRESVKKIK